MLKSFQVFVPVLLPILSGIMIGFFRPLRKLRAQRVFLIAALALNAAAVFMLIVQPEMNFELFRLSERIPIIFKTDSLAQLFCGLASLIFLIVGIYSPEYMKHEGNESRFYMFYLIVLGMLMGFGLSGNMMTLFLFFELSTLISFPLVMHSMEKEAVAAAFKFLYYSVAGASLALIGFIFVYIYGTTLEFVPGGVLNLEKLAGREGQMLAVIFLTIVGFGAKAGMFPLHAWLPAAHPVAPAPASAVLSGVITKAGAFAVIRFVYYLVGADFIRGTWVQISWISLALFSIIMGSALAFREPGLKRRLAFSSISQVSYVMLGLGVLNADGLIGALSHTVFHSIVKDALFLISGVILLKTRKTDAADLRGIGKQAPATMWCFMLLALSVVGVPPTSGFISKWYLSLGALASGPVFISWMGPVALLLSALLSAGYLLPIAIHGFFPGEGYENGHISLDPGFSMLLPVILLTAAAVFLGVFPGALISFFEGIAAGVS